MKNNNKYFKVNIDDYNDLCLSYVDKYKKKEEWKRVIIDGVGSDIVVSNYGRIFNIYKNKYPKIFITNNHYRTTIKLDNGESQLIGTYRLVALAFIPIPEKYIKMGYRYKDLVVDHIRDGEDDNFNDNTVWNLQWLTYVENTSKASKCGIRNPYPKDLMKNVDKMILDGSSNKEIYEYCYKNYNIQKEEMKGNIQVRRRRLNKTLKEHKEHDTSYTEQIDELIKSGFTNKEIYEKLDMDTSTRRSGRLIQYRRSLLGIIDQKSKYFTNEEK